MMPSSDCYEITHHDFIAAKTTTGVLKGLVFLLCIPAAALIVFLKAHKRLIPRLLLILVVVTFLCMLTDILELLVSGYDGPHNGTGYIFVVDNTYNWCIASAWLGQFFRLIIILLWCWITLHSLLSLRGKSCCIKQHWVYMIILVIALFLSAFPLVPLCPGKMMAYGLMGLGCGFSNLNSSCHQSECVLKVEVAFYYIPYLTGFVFILGILGYILLELCLKTLRGRHRPSLQVQFKVALESTWVLTTVIAIEAVLLLVIFITSFITRHDHPQIPINLSAGGAWVWYATVEPILFSLIPISVFIQPGTLKNLRWSKIKLAARKWIEKEEDRYETEYEVTGHLENSGEEERLIIRGSTAALSEGISTYAIVNK